MFFRAWRRVFSLVLFRPGALLAANLAFSLAVLLLVPAWAAAYVLSWPVPVLAVLKILSALWIWLNVSFLGCAMRDALEGRSTPLKELAVSWWKARLVERLASFWALAVLAAWILAGLYFYGGHLAGSALGRAGSVVSAVAGMVLAGATALDLGLASRQRVHWRGEWKSAGFMCFAFWPSCLAAGLSLVLLSGSLLLWVGSGSWMGRVLGAPAFLLPVIGAALMAAFLDALSDEFLATSMGVPAPEAGTPTLREWLRPWE